MQIVGFLTRWLICCCSYKLHHHSSSSFDPENQELKCYNVIAAEARSLNPEEKVMSDIFKSELAVPTCTGSDATRSHCALHVLGK